MPSTLATLTIQLLDNGEYTFRYRAEEGQVVKLGQFCPPLYTLLGGTLEKGDIQLPTEQEAAEAQQKQIEVQVTIEDGDQSSETPST